MALSRSLTTALARFVPRTSARPLHSIGDITLELRQMTNPNYLQRRILVWSRIFKTMDDVPNRVSNMQLKKAIDIFRVQFTTGLIVFGFVGSGVILYQCRQMRNKRDAAKANNGQIAFAEAMAENGK